MSKKKRWCDGKHARPPTNFDTPEKAKRLVKTIDQYITHDFAPPASAVETEKELLMARMKRISETAEEIEMFVRDANSIYAVYEDDWKMRRTRWITARGRCQRLAVLLGHVSDYMADHGTNIQKYVDISKDADDLSKMIKGVLISDNKKRKALAEKPPAGAASEKEKQK